MENDAICIECIDALAHRGPDGEGTWIDHPPGYFLATGGSRFLISRPAPSR